MTNHKPDERETYVQHYGKKKKAFKMKDEETRKKIEKLKEEIVHWVSYQKKKEARDK